MTIKLISKTNKIILNSIVKYGNLAADYNFIMMMMTFFFKNHFLKNKFDFKRVKNSYIQGFSWISYPTTKGTIIGYCIWIQKRVSNILKWCEDGILQIKPADEDEQNQGSDVFLRRVMNLYEVEHYRVFHSSLNQK